MWYYVFMITKDYIKSAPRHVFIMVGIPGSGKSTTSKKISALADEVHACPAAVTSADDFFMQDGEYKFDPSKLGDAHKNCMRQFLKLVTSPCSPVIVVDNTNLSIESMAAYAAAAHAYDYTVTLVFHHISAEESFKRNTHSVPAAACKRMHGQFEYLVGKTLRNTPVNAVFNFDSEGNDIDPYKL